MSLSYESFPQNKYGKWYIELVESRQQVEKNSTLTEGHHVFPVSIFGKNSVIVNLTHREHYIAHLLLWKAYLNNNKQYAGKMARAVLGFDSKFRKSHINIKAGNSKVYAAYREDAFEYMATHNKDYWSKEENRQAQAVRRNDYFSDPENLKKQTEINRRITSTPEWREQRSNKQKEFSADPEYTKRRIDAMVSPEAKAKSNASNKIRLDAMSEAERKATYGRERSAEFRKNQSANIKGRKYCVNLNTLEKIVTRERPSAEWLWWSELDSSQKSLFPKKSWDAGAAVRGSRWVFDINKGQALKIKANDAIPIGCIHGRQLKK